MPEPLDSLQATAQKYFRLAYDQLADRQKQIVQSLVDRFAIARDTSQDFDESMTFGQRIADQVASFGGSWTFIIIFVTVLVVWIVLNSVILASAGKSFDPYPFILLNLFLSMVAALQAPIILMSQNRQSVKDRMNAQHDYQVNLKAELEITNLHEKIDTLRVQQWQDLVKMQQEQIDLLTKIVNASVGTGKQ